MKKLLIIALVFTCTFVSAQVKFGIRAGLSSTDFNPSDLVITNSDDLEEFKLEVDNASYGVHFGLFTQIKGKRWFIQPEVVFNSNKVDYSFAGLMDNQAPELLSSRYNFVDVPINAGLKFGPLRIQGGPVGHFFVNSNSELTSLDGYKENFKEATWGIQYGFGIDIWKTVLDFKWERNFNDFGDHVTFNDVLYNFDDTQDRFIVSLGIAF